MFHSLTLKFILPAIAIFGIVYMAYAYSSGISGQTNKPGSFQGCTCHAAFPNPATTVTISGPDKYEAGKSYDMVVNVSNASENSAGIDLAAFKGTLASTDPGLIKRGGELTHRFPSALVNGKTSWSFKYTVPSGVTSDTLYASGNAVNLSGDNSGDQWNFANKLVVNITASSVAGTVPNAGILTLLANPVKDHANIIVSELSAIRATLRVIDSRGAMVHEVPTQMFGEGNTELLIQTSMLANGAYTLVLITDNGKQSTVKLLKIE